LRTQIDESAIDNFKAQIATIKLHQGGVLKDIEQMKQDKADNWKVVGEIKKINVKINRIFN
jgi:hypothetical protein